MKQILLFALLVPALFFSSERLAGTQTKHEKTQADQDKNGPRIITLKTGEPVSLAYDAGALRVLASSEDTNGVWSLVELTERPGYKTNLHRLQRTDEAFYVLEGVLTVKINGNTSEYPAGSFVLIPRGTPHAQGNLGTVPVRLLLTMTPGGFERSFQDRAELFKTVKPDHPDFKKRREENAKRWKFDVEFLEIWDTPE